MASFRRLAVIVLCSVAVLAPTAALGVATPQPVLTGHLDQWLPFANTTWLAYTSNSDAHSKHFNAFVQPIAGGSAQRVNEAGTSGFPGGFDPTSGDLIYEQDTTRDWALYLYDPIAQTRHKVSGVNSTEWEWDPRISTSFILFQRAYQRHGVWHDDILLYDRTTHHTRRLGTWLDSKTTRTGNVGDRYATFFVGSKNGWASYVYDAQTNTRMKINGPQKYIYTPVVDEANGTVYFAGSGAACGNANIWRLPISLTGPATKIVDLPKGIDIGYVASLGPDVVSGVDLYFYRFDCSKNEGDVYMVQQADLVT